MKEIQQDIWKLSEIMWWRPCHNALMTSNLIYRPAFEDANLLNFTDFSKNILDNI